jgi:hypothetical protein
MKTNRKSNQKRSNTNKVIVILILFTSVFFISCEQYGTDGYPGRAYLSVNWDVSKPDYLDVGTSDIPEIFEWGTYYRAFPGTYTLDYSGKVWKTTYWADYSWLVDYEIYENPGQQGGANYNGRNGLNSYFDIVCTPYGPDISSYDQQIKPDNNLNSITIIKNSGSYSIKITYKKVVIPTKPGMINEVATPAK